jgi:hypothetical protein
MNFKELKTNLEVYFRSYFLYEELESELKRSNIADSPLDVQSLINVLKGHSIL